MNNKTPFLGLRDEVLYLKTYGKIRNHLKIIKIPVNFYSGD